MSIVTVRALISTFPQKYLFVPSDTADVDICLCFCHLSFQLNDWKRHLIWLIVIPLWPLLHMYPKIWQYINPPAFPKPHTHPTSPVLELPPWFDTRSNMIICLLLNVALLPNLGLAGINYSWNSPLVNSNKNQAYSRVTPNVFYIMFNSPSKSHSQPLWRKNIVFYIDKNAINKFWQRQPHSGLCSSFC